MNSSAKKTPKPEKNLENNDVIISLCSETEWICWGCGKNFPLGEERVDITHRGPVKGENDKIHNGVYLVQICQLCSDFYNTSIFYHGCARCGDYPPKEIVNDEKIIERCIFRYDLPNQKAKVFIVHCSRLCKRESEKLHLQSGDGFILCGGCNKSFDRKLLLCGGCKKVRYCTKECQKSCWKIHKKVCGK